MRLEISFTKYHIACNYKFMPHVFEARLKQNSTFFVDKKCFFKTIVF